LLLDVVGEPGCDAEGADGFVAVRDRDVEILERRGGREPRGERVKGRMARASYAGVNAGSTPRERYVPSPLAFNRTPPVAGLSNDSAEQAAPFILKYTAWSL